MTEALRQKQIREVLDEDLRVNQKVLDRTFKMVRAYNDQFKEASPLQELVSWNIDKQISNLQEAIQNVIDEALHSATAGISNEDINKISTAYNLLVSYINNFAKSHKMNQRDKGVLDKKFTELEPLLNQIRQILSNPDAYNVDVSAQNLHIIDYIEQQIRDSNYRGLNVVDYKRIPIQSKAVLNRRGVVNDEEGDDDIPRGRNQASFGITPFATGLMSRSGTPFSESASLFKTPYRRPNTRADDEEEQDKAPVSFPSITEDPEDEGASYVPTYGNTEGASFLEEQTPKKKTPRTLPKPPPPKVVFNKNPKGYATIQGKAIYNDEGALISDITWATMNPQEKEELIQRTLAEGSGRARKGKKYIQKVDPHPILYDPDDNNLWAD